MNRSATRTGDRRGVAVLASLAGGTLLLHFLVSGRYGYWVDELTFIACGDRCFSGDFFTPC